MTRRRMGIGRTISEHGIFGDHIGTASFWQTESLGDTLKGQAVYGQAKGAEPRLVYRQSFYPPVNLRHGDRLDIRGGGVFVNDRLIAIVVVEPIGMGVRR